MKKFIFPLIMIIAIGVGLFEQTKEKPNRYVLIIAIVIFMYGMMRLSAKTPSKHKDENEEDAD